MLRIVIACLIAARVLALAVVIATLPDDVGGHFVASDALRYSQIATDAGRPYVDRAVEIPPVEVLALLPVATTDARATAIRNAVLQLFLDLLIAWSVWLGWGTRSSAAYLALSLPLAPFLAFRLDLLSVALAVLGLALVRREVPRAGGILVGLGVLAKLWPLGIGLALLVHRRWRSLWWMIGTTAATTAAWVAWSPGGPLQVVSFRQASGWQIESTHGAAELVLTDAPVVYEAGANRVGAMTIEWRAFGAVLFLVAVVAIGVLAWRAGSGAEEPSDDDGLDARVVAAVTGALLVFAPILSWQYIAWLVPWIAIAAVHRHRVIAVLGAAVIGLTACLLFLGVELTARNPLAMGVLVARNASLVALTIALIASLARTRARVGHFAHDPEPAGD